MALALLPLARVPVALNATRADPVGEATPFPHPVRAHETAAALVAAAGTRFPAL